MLKNIVLKQKKNGVNENKRNTKEQRERGKMLEPAYTSKKIKHLRKQKYSLRMLSIKVRTKPLEPIRRKHIAIIRIELDSIKNFVFVKLEGIKKRYYKQD